MRRRSVRLSAAGISASNDSVEHFNARFSLQSFLKRVRRLTDDQKKALQDSGFGNLLLVPNQALDKTLLLELMRRWDVEKHSFSLPCGFISPTMKDIAVILGLRVVGVPVTLDEDEPFLDIESRYGASLWKRKVTVASVESRLDSLGENCNEDFVRTFLLYAFGNFLFPNGDGKVDTRYVSYLKNVDVICNYAWGQAVLVHLIMWLDRRKELDVIYVGGCLLFLQIWSFEHIDVARPALVDCGPVFPRVCWWDKTKSSNKQQIVSQFKNLQDHQVTWELQPTPLELEIDLIKELLESQDNENCANGKSNSGCEIVNDIILDNTQGLRNNLETESESNPISEVQTEKEVNMDSPTHNILKVRTDVIDSSSVPCPALLQKDTTATLTNDVEEDVISRVQMLEAQNMELKEEILQLKRENERLKSSCSQLDENSANIKSEDYLRREYKFLSSVVARIERIVLDEDNKVGEIQTEELGVEIVNPSPHDDL